MNRQANISGYQGTEGRSAGDVDRALVRGQPPVVLLLLDDRCASWIAIQRAVKLADGLRGTLHVALAIHRHGPGDPPRLVASHVADLLGSLCPRLGFDLEIMHGPITDRAVQVARETSAAVVVVDAMLGAANVRRLVADLELPVLVARDGRPEGGFVAASDMSRSDFPVLARARAYARAFERDVTFFHNAEPVAVYIADPMAGVGTYAEMLHVQDDVAAARSARLRALARLDRGVETFVARAHDTTGALLGLAHERDADVIVVGHRSRSWFRRLFGRSVAERVVARSTCSVLVIPLGASRPAAATNMHH